MKYIRILFFCIYTPVWATFSLSNSTITQTGTDADLSGLASINGVVVTSQNNITVYNIGDRNLIVNGTLSIDPEVEMLIIGARDSVSEQFRLSGGTLNIGREITQNGYTRYSRGTAMYLEDVSDSFKNYWTMISGTFNWYGGVISMFGGKFGFYGDDCNVNIFSKNATLIFRQGASSNSMIRQETDNFITNGFTLIGGDLTIVGTAMQLNGFEPIHAGGALAFSSATPNVNVTLRGYAGGDKGNTKDIKFWQGGRPILINSATGSKLAVGPHISGNASSYGVALVYQELDLKINDISNNAIQGVKVYIKDTNNGNRETYNREGHRVNNTADNIYVLQTDSNGKTPTENILLAANVVNRGSSDAPNTGEYAWDYRGKNNDDSDLFDIHIWDYNNLYQVLSDVELKGVEGTHLSTKLITDLNISETVKGTVDAYTSIDDLDQLYDRVKSYKIDNLEVFGIENFIIKANGSVLELDEDWNIIIDDEASDVISVDEASKTLTVKSTVLKTGSKFKSISTTGSLSLENTATIEFGYIDDTGINKYVEINGLTNTTVLIRDFVDESDIQRTENVNGSFKYIFNAPSDASNIKIKLSRSGYSEWIDNFPENDLSYIRNVELLPLPDIARNQLDMIYLITKVIQKSEATLNELNKNNTTNITVNQTITDDLTDPSLENQEEAIRLLQIVLRKITAIREIL